MPGISPQNAAPPTPGPSLERQRKAGLPLMRVLSTSWLVSEAVPRRSPGWCFSLSCCLPPPRCHAQDLVGPRCLLWASCLPRRVPCQASASMPLVSLFRAPPTTSAGPPGTPRQGTCAPRWQRRPLDAPQLCSLHSNGPSDPHWGPEGVPGLADFPA